MHIRVNIAGGYVLVDVFPSAAPGTVDAYIDGVRVAYQSALQRVPEIVRKLAKELNIEAVGG